MELSDLLRRKFLRSTAAGAVALFAGKEMALPSAEGVAMLRAELDALWQAYNQDRSSEILIPAIRAADYAVRTLRTAPETGRPYQPLAHLAAEAATLAGAVSFDQNDTTVANNRHVTATEIGRRARSADLVTPGLEDQAWLAQWAGDSEKSLGLLDLMPVRQASPAVRASAELGRAASLARSGRAKPALLALDRSAMAMERAGDQAPALNRPALTEERLNRFRGYCFTDLGAGNAAYKPLSTCLRTRGMRQRHTGIINAAMARAGVQMDEIDRACAHALEAYRTFAAIKTTSQLDRIRRLRERDLAPYADTRADRELDEYLRAGIEPGPSYMVTRSRSGRDGLHRADCRYMRRGRPSDKRRMWADLSGRSPAELDADPAVQDAFDVCKACML